MAARGVDPLELPPRRFFNLVYWWAVRDADTDQAVEQFDLRLWRPPANTPVDIPAESPWSAEAETAAFQAFAAQASGGATLGKS